MNKSKFTTKPYFQRVEKPWGHEFIFASVESPVTGKILHVDEGKRFSLQYHDQKKEVLTLISGQALLTIENGKGEVTTRGNATVALPTRS